MCGYGLRRGWGSGGEAFGLPRAFLLSLVLHGLVLGSGHVSRLSEGEARPLLAYLKPGAAPPEHGRSAPVAEPRRQPVLTDPGGRAEAMAPPTVPGELEAPSAPPVAHADSAPSLSGVPGGSEEAPVPGLDADGLRRYRLAVGLAMRGARNYPAQARRQGWEGRVDLRLTVFADGRPCLVRLEKSSGHAVLDEQARNMLLGAALNASLPESLRGRDFTIPVTVRFDLED